ncbi:hypothetical protein [Streptomyces sp. NPDC049970]
MNDTLSHWLHLISCSATGAEPAADRYRGMLMRAAGGMSRLKGAPKSGC